MSPFSLEAVPPVVAPRPARSPAVTPGALARPSVVLLHSSGNSVRQWERLAAVLRPSFDVHAVEFHGHGSQPPWAGPGELTLADDAGRVLALLQQTGGAHVVGHSYGGAVAVKLATMAPGLVHSLVAYEPVLLRLLLDEGDGSGALDAIATADVVGRLLGDGDGLAAGRCFVEFWSGAGSWAALPELQRQSIARRMPSVMAHFGALFAESPARAWLAGLRTPILFLTGGATVQASRRIAELLRREVPQASHETLEGMGHMGPVSHAAQCNWRIARFLVEHALPGAGREALCA